MQFAQTVGEAKPYTVLIVEDDVDTADATKETLEGLRIPCRAVVAQTKARALAELQRNQVDAMLVDFRLPDGDGLQFISHANALEPGIPSILMTSYATGDLAQEATCDYHVAGILQKPFDEERLEKALRYAFRDDRDPPSIHRVK